MKALSQAIFSKFAGSTLGTDINGRLYKGQAPEGAEFPYAVYFVVSDVPEYPGGKTIERILLQFDLFSSGSGSTEIEDMLTHLRSLYDDVALTVTGYSSIYFIRGNMIPQREEIMTASGAQWIWHYIQEYEVEIVK